MGLSKGAGSIRFLVTDRSGMRGDSVAREGESSAAAHVLLDHLDLGANLPGSATLVSRSVLPGVGQVRAVPLHAGPASGNGRASSSCLITELTYLPQQGT